MWWHRVNLVATSVAVPSYSGRLGITQMLHVDRHRLGPTVARARLRVLIDHRAHHGSGRLLQAMDLEPETFPTERASSFVNVQPTYVGHSRSAPRSRSRSLSLEQLAWVEVREEVHEEVCDHAADVAQHLCLRRKESMGDHRSSTESTWLCRQSPSSAISVFPIEKEGRSGPLEFAFQSTGE
jgi:hypothetical protein